MKVPVIACVVVACVITAEAEEYEPEAIKYSQASAPVPAVPEVVFMAVAATPLMVPIVHVRALLLAEAQKTPKIP
jgi:hypothetical protein